MQQFSTVYNQFLKQIPRGQFQTCVDHYNGDYRVRKFNCWSQFTTMMYAQLTEKASLRALEIGLQNQAHHFYHVGLKKVSRSTVADTNQNRDWPIYEELFSKDQIIRIVGNKADNIPIELRLVTYCDPETGDVYVYLTNLFHLSALTIAQIYKARWEIELFFKWIKQHLKIKTFLGTTENAVMTQIWIAIITYLLLAYIKYKNKFQSSLLTLQRLICENIFVRMHLDQLLFPELRGVGGRHPQPPRNPAQLHLAL
jgi:hypothetical protein